jgi:hypothetical protein
MAASFIHHNQFSLAKFGCICWMDVLNGLSMIMENICLYYVLVEFRIAWLRNAVVFMVTIARGQIKNESKCLENNILVSI